MTSRRKFIQQMALGAAATTLSTSAFPNIIIPRKKDKLGIALMGLGYYSTDLLAPALQLTKHCYLAGIVTGTPAKAESWQKKHGIPDKNIYNYENFDDIANNPDIDVVYVVLPPALHREYTVRAANAGKHVFCEKPMAITAGECEAMIKACADNKVKLTIGYRMQHEPNTQEIIRYGQEKTFGKVQLISVATGFRSNFTNHWKMDRSMGGGAMYDMGVYALNASRYVTGEEPIAVLAQEINRRPAFTKADETTLFQLEFPSGAMANCSASFAMNVNYLQVTAERGWYRLEPFQAYNGIQGASSNGLLQHKIENEQTKQMDDDSLAIMNNTYPIVPGEEGLADIRVVNAIQLSAKLGRRVEL
ncbi:MAG: Gfo/Idh/MocA family oxidoreductase [Saprospiraceae bacterium]